MAFGFQMVDHFFSLGHFINKEKPQFFLFISNGWVSTVGNVAVNLYGSKSLKSEPFEIRM